MGYENQLKVNSLPESGLVDCNLTSQIFQLNVFNQLRLYVPVRQLISVGDRCLSLLGSEMSQACCRRSVCHAGS